MCDVARGRRFRKMKRNCCQRHRRRHRCHCRIHKACNNRLRAVWDWSLFPASRSECSRIKTAKTNYNKKSCRWSLRFVFHSLVSLFEMSMPCSFMSAPCMTTDDHSVRCPLASVCDCTRWIHGCICWDGETDRTQNETEIIARICLNNEVVRSKRERERERECNQPAEIYCVHIGIVGEKCNCLV